MIAVSFGKSCLSSYMIQWLLVIIDIQTRGSWQVAHTDWANLASSPVQCGWVVNCLNKCHNHEQRKQQFHWICSLPSNSLWKNSETVCFLQQTVVIFVHCAQWPFSTILCFWHNCFLLVLNYNYYLLCRKIVAVLLPNVLF